MTEQDIKAALEKIKAEIAAYPAPIAGCDAQFNHLLAERAALLYAINPKSGDRFSDKVMEHK